MLLSTRGGAYAPPLVVTDNVSIVSGVEEGLDAIAAATAFSGVVSVDGPDGAVLAKAYGLANRPYAVPNVVDTQFALASGTKGLTALTVVSLVEEGRLDLSTTARSVLGDDLPSIRDDVTVEHLLAHRSGIGDYVDEDLDLDLTEYLMPVPVHELATTEQYLTVLDGHPEKFSPGERFSYCNGGYVVLALIAERAGGVAVSRARPPARLQTGGHERYGVSPLGRASRPRCRRVRDDARRLEDQRLPLARAWER